MASLGGKYQIGTKIGGGGMAEVYRGAIVGAEGFSRPVAIKRIHASLSRDPKFGEMFINEARIASLLHHANVCSVLDFDRDNEGRYFLVMELVDGVDLHTLASRGGVSPPIVTHVIAEVLKGLDYAHELMHEGRHLQIVHRDVSPHNVMLSWQGAVKLVDFGIAKAIASTNASQSGALKGKVSYMSPEQAQGRSLDGRSDVFAVGVILHELLSGQRLFAGKSEPEVLSRVVSQPIPHPSELSPGAPQDLAAVAMRMLERDPASRFSSAHAALDAVLRCHSVTARGTLELRELLAARFAGRAPIRRADSEPAFAPTVMADGSVMHARAGAPPAAAPLGATGTAPASPAAVRATMGRTVTAPGTDTGAPGSVTGTGVGGDGPGFVTGTGVGGIGYASTVTAPGIGATIARPGRSAKNTAAILFAVVLLCGVAIGGALWLKARGSGAASPATDATADAFADAATAMATDAGPPAADAGPPAIDAAGDPAETRSDGKTTADPPATKDPGRTAGPSNTAERTKTSGSTKTPEPPDDSKADPRGTLWVRVDPWATVVVDGKNHGETPVRLRLSPGRHRVVLENTDGKRESFTVEIETGRTRAIKRSWR